MARVLTRSEVEAAMAAATCFAAFSARSAASMARTAPSKLWLRGRFMSGADSAMEKLEALCRVLTCGEKSKIRSDPLFALKMV